MVEALKGIGAPHEYHAVPGEAHGFTKAENVAACLEKELPFYLEAFKQVSA